MRLIHVRSKPCIRILRFANVLHRPQQKNNVKHANETEGYLKNIKMLSKFDTCNNTVESMSGKDQLVAKNSSVIVAISSNMTKNDTIFQPRKRDVIAEINTHIKSIQKSYKVPVLSDDQLFKYVVRQFILKFDQHNRMDDLLRLFISLRVYNISITFDPTIVSPFLVAFNRHRRVDAITM